MNLLTFYVLHICVFLKKWIVHVPFDHSSFCCVPWESTQFMCSSCCLAFHPSSELSINQLFFISISICTHNLLNLFSVACMYTCLGLTALGWIAEQRPSLWTRFSFSLGTWLLVVLYLRLEPCVISPAFTGMSTGVLIKWDLFRQSYFWDFVVVAPLPCLEDAISWQAPWCFGSYNLSCSVFCDFPES